MKRSKCLELSELQRLKQLEDENRRLKHIVAEQTLDIQALTAVVAQSGSPVAKRVAVGRLVDAQRASLRRACRIVGLSTATWKYLRQRRMNNRELLARLQAHAAVRPRYGITGAATSTGFSAWRKRSRPSRRGASTAIPCDRIDRSDSSRRRPYAAAGHVRTA